MRVDEIRVGHDGDPAPPDRAARDEFSLGPAIRSDCVKRSGRRGSRFLTACSHRLRSQLRRGGDPQPPVFEQSRIGEGRGRAKWVAERAVARPLKRWVGQQQQPSPGPDPGIELDEHFRRLRPRLNHEQQAVAFERGGIGDADRAYPVAALQRFQRWRLRRVQLEPLGEDDRQAGKEQELRPFRLGASLVFGRPFTAEEGRDNRYGGNERQRYPE